MNQSSIANHSKNMSRRDFLLRSVGITLGTWLLGFVSYSFLGNKSPKLTKIVNESGKEVILIPPGLYEAVSSMPYFGQWHKSFYLSSSSKNRLLADFVHRWSTNQEKTKNSVEVLTDLMEDDFKNKKVLNHRGWVLSHTDIAISVLADYAKQGLVKSL